MDDELSVYIENLGSLYPETRREAALQLEANGQAALHLLVDALQSTNPVLRMEAQRLIGHIVQPGTLSPLDLSAPEPDPIPENVGELVTALRSPSISLRERVEERLVSQRASAIPALIQAMPSANPIHASRIARMLARLQAVEAIPALVVRLSLRDFTPDITVVNSFDELRRLLPGQWRALGLNSLLALLQGDTVPHVRSAQVEEAVAETLVHIAHEEPVPQLRSALPYLKRPWYRGSMALNLAYRFVDKATQQWKDLPLPAQNSEARADLPRPAEPDDTSPDNLPNPAKRV